MPKKKKITAILQLESEIWTRTKGYSDYIGILKDDIVSSALKLYFKTLDDIEKGIEKEGLG